MDCTLNAAIALPEKDKIQSSNQTKLSVKPQTRIDKLIIPNKVAKKPNMTFQRFFSMK